MSFWDTLMSRGMDEVEAYRRQNYYNFARHLPGLDDPEGYVLETPYEELPLEVSRVDEELYEYFIECVRKGEMTAYEAAVAYYDEATYERGE